MKIKNIIDFIKKNVGVLNKKIGQNYLINIKILKKIVLLLDINNDDNILEVGSGLGNLSFFLLKKKCKKITLNDIDNKNILFLKKIVKNNKKVNIINKSALKIKISKYSKIVSNLPYYVTHSMLEHFMVNGNAFKYIFMVQKEVFEKINAKPNNFRYGPLNIIINYVGKINKEFNVSKENFLPVPHINSVVFSITKNDNKIKINRCKYIFFLKKMFIHRRKTIFNNLSLFLNDKLKAKKILHDLKISEITRPEQVCQNIYLNIFKKISKLVKN